MKKANFLVALFLGLIATAALSRSQNASGIMPASGGAGDTRHDTPSMEQQTGDARGSSAAQAAAQSTPVQPDKSITPARGAATNRGSASLAIPDSTSEHEIGVAPVTGTIALDSTSLSQKIQQLPYDSRATFLKDLEIRLASNEQEFIEVKATSTNLKGPARDAFESALSEWKTQHHALRRNLASASSAKSEDWAKIRNALAASYESYAIALTRLEAASALH